MKENAKGIIKELVEKYERIKSEGRIRSYNEEMTKKDFILPLFKALGWDVENKKFDEVTAEEKISKKKVDYGFRINGIPKFFLEAKPLYENLDGYRIVDGEKVLYVEQAINYAWHKGCTWAVLTNFEDLKVFNAEVKSMNPLQSLFFSLYYNQYLDRFDQLCLLSKESFEQGLIDKEAEKWGKKLKKISVDKQLLSDLTRFREKLSKNILKNNESKNLTQEEIDEAVQRLIDRLIFIRTCEDRQLEAHVLIPLIREQDNKRICKKLKEVFRKFDEGYNSKLFLPHLCEELIIDDEVLETVITGLFRTKDDSVHYDFSAIEADVLGNIYEQYLGCVLKKTEKRAKLTTSHVRRKERGVYYTPTYIVDYIVRNTLGELLKNKKVDAEKIRVLDPACGSGSFLIKAFDVLGEYYSKKGEIEQTKFDTSGKMSVTFTKKVEILKNNIFGVDLDSKAVEIAQLNLLMKIAEKSQRLPLLQENIKVGNSLIDDQTIAGEKAFKWEEQFADIIKEGGFDVVIGNPPYVRVDSLNERDKIYWKKKFTSAHGKYDLYYLFVESVFSWLKEEGLLGFIIPNKFCAASSAKNLRELIISNSNYCTIISVSHLDIFKDASNYPVILIIRKGKKLKKFEVGSVKKETEFLNRDFICYFIKKEDFEVLPDKIFPININQEQFDLVIKLVSNNERLVQYLRVSEGLRIPSSFEELTKRKFEILKQYQFEKWGTIREGSYISESNLGKVISVTSERYKNLLKDKIVIAEDALTITATIDVKGMVPQGGVYFAVLIKSSLDIKYVLGLLNSKLLSFVYKTFFGGMHMGGGYLRYRTEFLEQLPIKIIPESQQQPIIKLVNKMLSLNKRLNEIGDKKTDEKAKLEEEIKKTDAEIDELVYKIYGITEEEKKIIEESLK